MAGRSRTAGKVSYSRERSASAPLVVRETLVHMNEQGRLTLPASTRRALGLQGEADLQLSVENYALVLKPAVILPVEDAWAYTSAHRALLRRAHADSRAGRVRTLSERQLDRLA